MDDADGGSYARDPQIEDLARICQALNDAGARYLLIGGFAVMAHGGNRTTKDIDLLVDASPENVARVKRALCVLEDHAATEVADDDVRRYTVVRIADEVLVDLMAKACGIDYDTAAKDREFFTIGGVSIPTASLRTLIRTKETYRPSDMADRQYLQALLEAERDER